MTVADSLSPGPQYGSVERAWLAVMTEAEKVSELHQDVKNNLLNDDVEKVKNWQKEAYHKQMIGGFKEAKEAEEGFKKAQKPWAKKLKEVRAPSSEGVSTFFKKYTCIYWLYSSWISTCFHSCFII